MLPKVSNHFVAPVALRINLEPHVDVLPNLGSFFIQLLQKYIPDSVAVLRHPVLLNDTHDTRDRIKRIFFLSPSDSVEYVHLRL